jgi:hypothetical protein
MKIYYEKCLCLGPSTPANHIPGPCDMLYIIIQHDLGYW